LFGHTEKHGHVSDMHASDKEIKIK